MWRKQDDSKAPSAPAPSASASPEVKAPARVEPVAPLASAPVQAAASTPAGHLTSSLTIKGEITGREDFYIDGKVQGTIRLEDGRVTVGPNGHVMADIEAREIVIRGEVKGNLRARDRIQIGQTGRATGNVVTRRISVDDGAEISGKVEVTKAEEPRPSRATPSVAAGNGEQLPREVAAMQAVESTKN